MFVKSALTRLGNFDWALIYECAHLHDHGEPLTGGDEHDGNKTQDKEIREYRAFRDVVSIEGEQLQTAKMMAFLLPYVRRTKWWSEFSLQDQKIVRQLATTHHREAIVFELIERMDYVFSGLEGYQLGITNEAETMLSHVLRNQVPKLNALTAELKVLTQVWGLELSQELLTLES